MKAAAATLLLLAPAAAGAQGLVIPPVVYPSVPARAASAEGFVPPGWTIVARRSGDLNGDDAADLVLLLRMQDPANILAVPLGDTTEPFDTNPHLLVAAFAGPQGGYWLATTNSSLFPRPVQPWTGEEAPGEDTLRLQGENLLVHFGYLRGWAEYRFRWQADAFRLIGYDHGGASGGCIETLSVNYLTGRARVTKELIGGHRAPRVAWRRLPRAAPPTTLDNLDLDSFAPELELSGPPLLCPDADRE